MPPPIIIPISSAEELVRFGVTDVAPLTDELFRRHQPGLHLVAVSPATDNRLLGRCSIWGHSIPAPGPEVAGVVGHFAGADVSTGTALLAAACQALYQRGCRMVIGPMDGNTWRSYRLVTTRGVEPPFFLEPTNPEYYPEIFASAGFTPLAHYYSALADDLNHRDPRLVPVERRLTEAGVTIRALDIAHFSAEAERIYELSRIAFTHNFLYTPVPREEFLAQYAALSGSLRPELCRLAEHDGQLVGYVFAIPDLLQARLGNAIDTVIVKTVAVRPGRLYAGLGSYLVEQVQPIDPTLGYRRAIHALMHETNKSRNLS
ncbi:MAG: N-acetyltransferase, partial [Phycisphaerae bacterium]